jgi:acyl carrier protein
MKRESTEKLRDVFRAVFDLPASCDVTQVRQTSVSQWDSLAHVSLVVAIESEFEVTIDTADAMRMTSYADTQLVLEEMGL